jgi:hypothetical protein
MKSIKGCFASCVRSRTTYVCLVMGMLVYCSYGFGSAKWDSAWLFATSIFVALTVSPYSLFINRVDAALCDASGLRTAGRLGRLAVHTAYNVVLFSLLVRGEVILSRDIENIGGILGASLLTTLAGQGAQYVAIMIADSGRGDRNWNILLCGLMTTTVTAIAMLGHPSIQSIFTKMSLVLGVVIFGKGVITDVRNFLNSKS